MNDKNEKHDKINGVVTYHKKTRGGMAVFYPKHDITIKKDEKIILHCVFFCYLILAKGMPNLSYFKHILKLFFV